MAVNNMRLFCKIKESQYTNPLEFFQPRAINQYAVHYQQWYLIFLLMNNNLGEIYP